MIDINRVMLTVEEILFPNAKYDENLWSLIFNIF